MAHQSLSTSPASEANAQSSPLLIFDTHPIQYRSPVFRALVKNNFATKVFYFNAGFDGGKWWFHEAGKIPDQKWDLDLRAGFPHEVLDTHGRSAFATFATLREVLRRERPRAILIFGYYLPEHWMLWWLAQEMRIPLLFVGETFKGGGSAFRRLIKGAMQPLWFRGIAQFVAIGEKTFDFYRSFRIDGRKITRARYCIDTEFFARDAESHRTTRARIRRELNISDDAFVMLFVGRLFDRKRPRDLVAAHKILSDSKVYTVIVGNGELEETLRQETSPIANVRMVGFKNQGETRDYYHAADCLVVPSEYETWGLVVNEALAAGLPAIVTDACGCADDLVVDEQTGYVVGVGRPEAIAQRVRQLKKDANLRAEMAARGIKKVRENYSVEQFAAAIESAVDRCSPRQNLFPLR